jgi:nucleotide-binding universal stress UspA family protein
MPYKRILVPHDCYKMSSEALRHAIDIAKPSSESSVIILLHVIQNFPVPHLLERPTRPHEKHKTISTSGYLSNLYMQIKSRISEVLDEEEEMCAKQGIKVQTKIAVGRPADQILKFAEKEKIDLIVIGSRRLKGLSKVRALGSVSRNVAAKAPCPVLTVR